MLSGPPQRQRQRQRQRQEKQHQRQERERQQRRWIAAPNRHCCRWRCRHSNYRNPHSDGGAREMVEPVCTRNRADRISAQPHNRALLLEAGGNTAIRHSGSPGLNSTRKPHPGQTDGRRGGFRVCELTPPTTPSASRQRRAVRRLCAAPAERRRSRLRERDLTHAPHNPVRIKTAKSCPALMRRPRGAATSVACVSANVLRESNRARPYSRPTQPGR